MEDVNEKRYFFFVFFFLLVVKTGWMKLRVVQLFRQTRRVLSDEWDLIKTKALVFLEVFTQETTAPQCQMGAF